jgi:hypothetical protein
MRTTPLFASVFTDRLYEFRVTSAVRWESEL